MEFAPVSFRQCLALSGFVMSHSAAVANMKLILNSVRFVVVFLHRCFFPQSDIKSMFRGS